MEGAAPGSSHHRPATPSPHLPNTRPSSLLVIGYGSTLRGDDAAGPRVAQAIEQLAIEQVRVLVLPQLNPEIAADLAECDLVIFVDARLADGSTEVQVRALSPTDGRSTLGHTGDPASLLGLAESLYGHCPEARLVTIPAANLEYGESLSSTAAVGVAVAVRKIRALLRSHSRGGSAGADR